jgi:ribA/ribD-fused uncharacterized protein
MTKTLEHRTYCKKDCVTFRKTNEAFGGLSNMAGGYPLLVNGVRILTSEALYQACRFPHLPDVQRMIIAERSPMTAKMKSKPYRNQSRSDWDSVRVKIMRWCLRVKLAQNWERFSSLLLSTGDRPIVEDSRKDNFWGAIPVDGETLTGANVLGRLLMELRELLKGQNADSLQVVIPPPIPEFLLYGQEICIITRDGKNHELYKIDNTKIEHQIPEVVSFAQIEEKQAIVTHNQTAAENKELNILPQQSLLEKPKELSDAKEEYDSFYIMLPYIEKVLATERKEKDIAAVFKVSLNQMRDWLKRAVELDKVKKLNKPVRYISSSRVNHKQLSLLD